METARHQRLLGKGATKAVRTFLLSVLTLAVLGIFTLVTAVAFIFSSHESDDSEDF